MPTLQETFDIVASHLLRQGRRSVDSEGRCLYRGPNGLKCGAGCLIPDELYDPDIEGRGVKCSEVEAVLDGHDLEVCRIGQLIHDTMPPKEWPDALAMYADRLGLTFTPPQPKAGHVQA